MRRSRTDEASTHVLEAVLMASLMVAGVAFVVDFQGTGEVPAFSTIAKMYDQKTGEFVDIAFDWPLPKSSCNGDSKGDEWLASAARGARSAFRDDMNRSFREGVKGDLLFENGYGEMYLYKEHGNLAIAGHTKSYEPNWTGAYVLPSLSAATGTETVEINTAAVVKSEIQMQKGDGVEILVTFLDGQQKRLYASTAMLADVWQYKTFAQNLSLVTPGTTMRKMIASVEADQIAPEGIKTRVDLAFAVSPGPRGTSNTAAEIPAGTTLRLRFPPQWTDFDLARVPASWTPDQTGDASIGYTLEFVLSAAATTNQTIILRAFAPTAPTVPFDRITADL